MTDNGDEVGGERTDQVGPLVSVRCEVERAVDPDRVVLHGAITVARGDKSAALAAAAVAVDSLKTALAALGGRARSATTTRHALTWSTEQISTYPEHDPTKPQGMTGQIIANVAMSIALRDFTILDQLDAFLTESASFDLSHTGWSVDSDNAAWASLRAEAIDQALRKGRDYATALGASLISVEHVADVGLLGGNESSGAGGPQAFAAMGVRGGTSPSLDPIPQVLVARIEARFRTTPVKLRPPAS